MATLTVTSLADQGAGSLRATLAAAQAGDTVRFSSALAGQTLNLSQPLTVAPAQNITVDGGDAPGLTLSGGGTTRILQVNSNQDFPTRLALRNLTLTQGYTPERGGAIRTTHRAELTVENVTFTSNVADQGGGAIDTAFEGRLTVLNSRFDNNQALAGNKERGAGAIAFHGPRDFIVRDSVFTHNQGINGGAINNLNGQLTVENSRFIHNRTTAARFDTGQPRPFLRGYGGAIYTDRASSSSDATSGTIRIANSVFEGNQGRGEGGAAYLYTGSQDAVLITGSTFRDNQVVALPGGNGGNGGAVVQLTNGENRGFTLQDSHFLDNTATGQGGGLWMMGGPAQVSNTTFEGNRVTGQGSSNVGGAMALYGTTALVNTTLVNNYAGWTGGAIAANTSRYQVSVQDSVFVNNTADNGPNDWGIQQHTTSELIDRGGNIQYPPKATRNFNDYNATATIALFDPQLVEQPDGTFRVTNAAAAGSGAGAPAPAPEVPGPIIPIPGTLQPGPVAPTPGTPLTPASPIPEAPLPNPAPLTLESPLTPTLTTTSNLLKTPTTPLTTQFRLTSPRPEAIEVGLIPVDDAQGAVDGLLPGSPGYEQQALGRGRVLFSQAPGADLPPLAMQRTLELAPGRYFQLFAIEGGTRDEVLQGRSAQVRFSQPATPPTLSGPQLTWQPDLPSRPALTFDLAFPAAPPLGAQLQSTQDGELLDLRSFSGPLQVSITVHREAAFNNAVGFYKVATAGGAVRDALGALIAPGQAGYREAALAQQVMADLTVEDGDTQTLTVMLEGGELLAPFIAVNGADAPPQEVYFAFTGANSDRKDHVRLLADNTFGFEDMPHGGDLDYDDMIVQLAVNG